MLDAADTAHTLAPIRDRRGVRYGVSRPMDEPVSVASSDSS